MLDFVSAMTGKIREKTSSRLDPAYAKPNLTTMHITSCSENSYNKLGNEVAVKRTHQLLTTLLNSSKNKKKKTFSKPRKALLYLDAQFQ